MAATGILAELKERAAVATRERAAAEEAERQSLFAHEEAKAAAARSTRRRTVLAEALEHASAAEDAGRDRLGQCRLARAAAAREADKLADAAAAGSDPASRAIAKATDSVETASSIVLAHERRVRALAEERGAAELALAAHDAAVADADQRGREALLVQAAELVDRNLEAAGSAACQFVAILADARRAHTKTGWSPAFSSDSALRQFLQTAHHFGDRLEIGHATSGGGGRLYWTWSRFAQDFLGAWAAREKPAQPAAGIESAPAEAA